MLPVLMLCLIYTGVYGEPETVREVSEYFGMDKELDPMDDPYTEVHLQTDDTVVLRPQEVKNWPQQALNVGQITAVSINSLGQPVIFHRAERVWDESSFNESNVYQNLEQGPIAEDTILVLDPYTGSVLHGWGAYMFYMPHGLTVDHHDHVWVTDVAKHQVFKYTPNNHKYPSLTLGEAFTSGSLDDGRVLFCMPTSVAVASTGETFVADGYCNSAVLKFNAAGVFLTTIPVYDREVFNVPHSVTLLEQMDRVCIADRENRRIVCPKAGLKSYIKMMEPATIIMDPSLGRVFGIAACNNNMLYAVNGPTNNKIAVRGFTVDAVTGEIVDTWVPYPGFQNPHALAITKNGSHLYVTEIGPNKIWKFELKDVYDK